MNRLRMLKERNNFLEERYMYCAGHHVLFEPLRNWINDPNRKPAITAFTEGLERQIAYAIERMK